MVLLYLLNLFCQKSLTLSKWNLSLSWNLNFVMNYIHIQVTQFMCRLIVCIVPFFYERYIMTVKKDKDTSSSISSTSSHIFPSSILAQVSGKHYLHFWHLVPDDTISLLLLGWKEFYCTLWCRRNIVQYPWLKCMTEQEMFHTDQYRPTIVDNRSALNGLCKKG